MPTERQPPQMPEVNPETEPFVFSPDQFRDAMALQIVNQTFNTYETYRTVNHDRRWNNADALYSGYVPARAWEGTNIPRANLPVQISFDQVHSAYPSIMQALFSDEDWFEVVAEPGVSPQEAADVQAAMKYMLDHSKNDYGLSTVSEVGLSVWDLLKYGNGGIWIDWDGKRNRPAVSWVDIRDVYIDPATPTANTDESRSIIRRRMMTVNEIQDYSADTRMKVPEDSILWSMAKSAPSVPADTTRQVQESLRSVDFSPQQADWIPNPADRKIEVLTYFSKNQIVWVLNRQHVMYNAPNPYGFVPTAFAPCYITTGHFYADGIPEVQDGNQRMIEGMLNGHLDEISLALHPPRAQARSSNITNNQRKWGPGFVFSVDNVKDDLQLLQPAPVTQNVMSDIGFIMDAAEKRTGIGAMAQGMPRPGNANRTATGMSLQSQGAANRLQPIVKNIEDYLLIPMLRKLYKMMSFHLGLYDKVPAKKDGVVQWVEGWKFQRPCDFKMKASSQMLAKANLMQIFPFVTQYLLSGPLLEALKAAGQTVDYSELLRMMQDAAGTQGRYALIRPMNPQEQQAAQQPPPQLVAEQQLEAQKHQNSKEIMGMKIQGDLQSTMISKQGSPEEMQMKMAEGQQKMQIEAFKAEMDAKLQQQKLDFEREMAKLKLQVEVQKSQISVQSAQQKMVTDAQSAQTKMQLDQQKMQSQMEMDQQRSQSDLQTAMIGNQQKLTHTEQSHQMAMKQQKEMAASKPASGGTTAKPRRKAEVKKRPK